MVPVPLTYANLTESGPASNCSLLGGGRRLITWATAQPLESLIDRYHQRGDVRPPKSTTQRLLFPVPGLVSLCYCTAIQLHSPLRGNEDTVALQNWNIVHEKSWPALLSHQNTERDSKTKCTEPWCHLLVALWMFRQEWTLQYRLSIPYSVVYCWQLSFTFVRTN